MVANKTTTKNNSAPKTYKENQVVEIQHNQIVIQENIRNDWQVLDPKLLESIRVNGVEDPIVVTPKLVLLDGHRRYTALNALAEEQGKPSIPVRVLIKDIPDNEIAKYQYTTGHDRKNISSQDTLRAVTRHAERNPELSDRDLAVIFRVSPSTVFTCTRIMRVPSLKNLVTNKLLTQNAAIQIINHFVNESGLSQDEAGEETFIENTEKALQGANKLGEELISNISGVISNNTENKVINPWTLRNVNTYLTQIGEPEIPSKIVEPAGTKKKYTLVSIVQSMVSTFTITPKEDETVNFEGSMSAEMFEALKELLEEKKKGLFIEEQCSTTGEDTFKIWSDYKAKYRNAVVLVQQSASRWRSFEGDIKTVAENLGIEVTQENGMDMVTLGKREIRKNISALTAKGIDVVKVNKVNAENRSAKSNARRKADSKVLQKDQQELIETLTPESQVKSTNVALETINSQIEADLETLEPLTESTEIQTLQTPQVVAQTSVLGEDPTVVNKFAKVEAKAPVVEVLSDEEDFDDDDGVEEELQLLVGGNPKTAAGFEAFVNTNLVNGFSDEDDEEE